MDKWENAVHYQTVQKEKAAKVKAVNTDRIEEVLSGAKEHVEIDYGEEQILSIEVDLPIGNIGREIG